MANGLECEKQVIESLISVISRVFNCDSSGNDESEVLLIDKVLQILLAQNASLYDTQERSGVTGQILDNQEFPGENSTNVTLIYADGEIPTISEGVDTTGSTIGSIGTNKLHQLEIIKVFVLIFVISIILLTTCRMVFQLFIRFRPEKPPLA